MRPLPTWPTNTFQSPKLATREGLAASAVFSRFGRGRGLGLGWLRQGGGRRREGAGGACGRNREPDRAKG